MVGKTQGSYAATYAYRFGDKLKAATSSFPGETASVGYNYDGLGRRRLEQRDNTTATWFRWSGSEECGDTPARSAVGPSVRCKQGMCRAWLPLPDPTLPQPNGGIT